MKRILLILSLLSFSYGGYAQKKIIADNKIYNAVDVNPKFPGGEEAFGKFVSDNTRFPEKDKDDLINNSRTILQFVVEKNGSLTDFRKIRGSKGVFDEIVAGLKKGPQWTPGHLSGKIVRVRYTVPITICLAE
jgi:protein TonB